jgi:Zn-dependent peptidase ImmA (M78 family)
LPPPNCLTSRMPPPSRRRAEARAHALLDKLGIDEVPVPVNAIAEALGIHVIHQPMQNAISGVTYRHDSITIIGLNASHHPRRQRFTAAHELGHAQLHPGRPITIDSSIRIDFRDEISSQATDGQEIEANAYAAALLMPRHAILTQAQQAQTEGARTRDRLITALAETFEVSTEAMGYRLINLGVISST